jgi:hypothetical protein
MSSRGGSRSKSPRAMALEGIRAKLARQTFDWQSSPAKIFHLERFDGHGVEFTDRANVLVGVTNVELALEMAIRSHFVELSPDESSALFGGGDREAPLSNFGSKIKIGHAMGVYQKLFSDDLKVIQLVRNYFAHSAEYVDFSDPALKSAAQVLNFPQYGFDKDAREIFNATRDPKGAFIETCKWAMMAMIGGRDRRVVIDDRRYFPAFPWPDASPGKDE